MYKNYNNHTQIINNNFTISNTMKFIISQMTLKQK